MTIHETLPATDTLGEPRQTVEKDNKLITVFDCPDGLHEITFYYPDWLSRGGGGYVAVISSKAEYDSDDYEPSQCWWGCNTCQPSIVNYYDPIRWAASPYHLLSEHIKAEHPDFYKQK